MYHTPEGSPPGACLDQGLGSTQELSNATGSESSDTYRDTDISPVSSPALPADPAWSRWIHGPPHCTTYVVHVGGLSRSQALFEDAVGDGTYFADPNFEWEEEAEETKHGRS